MRLRHLDLRHSKYFSQLGVRIALTRLKVPDVAVLRTFTRNTLDSRFTPQIILQCSFTEHEPLFHSSCIDKGIGYGKPVSF